MQLETFNPKDAETLGITGLPMENLGPVVALFGCNGAGKSRLLNLAHKWIETQRDGYEAFFNQDDSEFGRFRHEPQSGQRVLKLATALKKQFGESNILERSQTLSQLIGQAPERIDYEDVVTRVFDQCAHALFMAGHESVIDTELAFPLQCARELQGLTQTLLGMEFGYIQVGSDALPALNDRRIDTNEISPGQKRLLSIAVYLLEELLESARNGDVSADAWKGSILIIDEPELHLHASATREVIRGLKHLVGNEGQLWIGTHCVPLLADLLPSEVWTIENGRVQHPSAIQTQRVLSLLVGNEESQDRFREALAVPAQQAAASFAAQCLKSPAVVEYSHCDPQLELVNAHLAAASEEISTILLDVGAGRGRLASALRQDYALEASHVRYLPVEPNESLHTEIRLSAADLLDQEFQVMRYVNEVPTEFDDNIDYIVLCNVLHEIPPQEWVSLFEKLRSLLAPTGEMLVIEDQVMPIGERPHRLGYLVLGEREIKTLLGTSSVCIRQHESPAYADRIMCVSAAKEVVSVTKESVFDAIENLRRRSEAEVLAMREQNLTDARSGRLYGFYSQMLINAAFALKQV